MRDCVQTHIQIEIEKQKWTCLISAQSQFEKNLTVLSDLRAPLGCISHCCCDWSLWTWQQSHLSTIRFLKGAGVSFFENCLPRWRTTERLRRLRNRASQVFRFSSDGHWNAWLAFTIRGRYIKFRFAQSVAQWERWWNCKIDRTKTERQSEKDRVSYFVILYWFLCIRSNCL